MLNLDIVCASHRDSVLQENLLSNLDTTLFKQLHVMTGFNNVPMAYNAAMVDAKYVMWLHEDVKLSKDFFSNLEAALTLAPQDFGVLGVAGVKLNANGERLFYGNISDRGKPWGSQYDLPKEVDTLDELLIITHRGVTFDVNLPLDFYAADMCMQMKKQGKKNYAINAHVEHNSTRPFGGRTPSFHFAHDYFRDKWIDYAPIGTTCTVVKK